MSENLKNAFNTNKIIENPLKIFQQKGFNRSTSKISFKVDKFIHKELQWYKQNYIHLIVVYSISFKGFFEKM